MRSQAPGHESPCNLLTGRQTDLATKGYRPRVGINVLDCGLSLAGTDMSRFRRVVEMKDLNASE